MEVAGEDNASFCVGVVQQDRQTVPCRCKFVVGSLHRTEQRALAATAPPASGQAPQSPSPASVLTHAHGNGLTVVVVVVASAVGTDRTSMHRIHIGEEAKVWNGRSLASSTLGPDSEHSDSPTAYKAAAVRPWTAVEEGVWETGMDRRSAGHSSGEPKGSSPAEETGCCNGETAYRTCTPADGTPGRDPIVDRG
jgi:hypothetical protein